MSQSLLVTVCGRLRAASLFDLHAVCLAVGCCLAACGGGDTPDDESSAGPTGGSGGTSAASADQDPSMGGDTDPGDMVSFDDLRVPVIAADPETTISFFVAADRTSTADLGGLQAADFRCQTQAMLLDPDPAADPALATERAVQSQRVWRAYLSTSMEDAKDRIGPGPWLNYEGVTVASDLEDLHTNVVGDPDLFLTNLGTRVNGLFPGSLVPPEHDILTGSTPEGTVMLDALGTPLTCEDWTSASSSLQAQVGHSDGIGLVREAATAVESTDPPYNSWNSVHPNSACSDTLQGGGVGRIYCFALPVDTDEPVATAPEQ